VENSAINLQVVCNVCGRKIKNFCELFSFVSNGIGVTILFHVLDEK
jgi:hypothetical protein